MNLYMTKETIIHGVRTAIPHIIKTFVLHLCCISLSEMEWLWRTYRSENI